MSTTKPTKGPAEMDCRNCRHCEAMVGDLSNASEDDPLQCNWQPAEALPVSWRYTRREVIIVSSTDALDCKAFDLKTVNYWPGIIRAVPR